MDNALPVLAVFNVFVFAMLALDLGVLNAKNEAIPPRQAMFRCLGYMAMAGVFGAGIFHFYGSRAGYEFFTGYIIEQSLSVDNMFVFLLIFAHFQIPQQHQHRVLFYGVLGALIMRGLFIYTGVTLVAMSHWVLALFGAFLVITSIKMLMAIESEPDIEHNRILMFARRRLRVSEHERNGRFWVRKGKYLYATPLLLVLILVEATDIVFALDSIPAIFAVTQDPVIIYTSNVFAILGLRALYFTLAGVMEKFHYLKYGVSLTLMMIGGKMVYASVAGEEILSTQAALGVTAMLIFGSMAFSLLMARLRPAEAEAMAKAPPTGWVLGSPPKEEARPAEPAQPEETAQGEAGPADVTLASAASLPQGEQEARRKERQPVEEPAVARAADDSRRARAMRRRSR